MHAQQLNELSRHAIGAAIAVHRELGPGLEEEDYEMVLSAELTSSGIGHRCQVPLPIVYKSVRLDAGFRLDVLVEESLILEVKGSTGSSIRKQTVDMDGLGLQRKVTKSAESLRLSLSR